MFAQASIECETLLVVLKTFSNSAVLKNSPAICLCLLSECISLALFLMPLCYLEGVSNNKKRVGGQQILDSLSGENQAWGKRALMESQKEM